MICVSITEPEIDSMVRIANSVGSDLVELRLDYLNDFSEIEKIKNIRKPKISTCMPVWEGGKFKGSEEKRIEILLSAIEFSNFVTIELRTKKSFRDRLIKKAKENGVKVIISYHDFNSTPKRKDILKILKKEKAAGADIAKIGFIPKNYADVLNTMYVLVENKLEIPIIAVSMGKLGRISRVLAPILGSYLTYASVKKGKESAEGQLTVKELRNIFNSTSKMSKLRDQRSRIKILKI